jgi:3-isopropylmalate/(R)-2-methylmalate dehydratase small subunit
MIRTFQGRAWKLGDDIDTDVIYPGRYLPLLDPSEMAAHALEGIDPEFPAKLRPGDILAAGRNFGCGSSREQAATCLKTAGVACVIAGSFSRIFFRNAVNLGLPLVECREAADAVTTGDTVAVDFQSGIVTVGGRSFPFPPLPETVLSILEEGGLINSIRKKIAAGKIK